MHQKIVRLFITPILLICLSTVLMAATPAAPIFTEPFDFKLVNEGWSFCAEDSTKVPELSKFQAISIPHTWNAADSLTKGGYRRAGSWYRYGLENLPHKHSEGERLYLRFKGVGQVAKVYAGPHLLETHRGSYNAFTVDLTNFLEEKSLFVYVSNSAAESALPLSADFTFFGGIYRNVILYKTKSVSVSRLAGGSGLRIIPGKIDKKVATHQLRVDLSNASKPREVDLKITLRGPDKKIVATKEEAIPLKSGQASHVLSLPDIQNPELWSPDQPNLYSLELQLVADGKILDLVNERFGVRFFHFDADRGFFLNGEHLKLNGINRHQDKEGKGIALSEGDHLDDIKAIKELGMNFLRLAHYQQDDHVLDLCDEMGLLVWEEIPYVNFFGEHPDFVIDLHNALRAMIVQHYNHPSIILWGIGNEVLLRETKMDSLPIYNVLESLNQTVHDLDPGRSSVMACHGSSKYSELGISRIPDVLGYNLYTGWYMDGLTTSEVVGTFERFRKENPGKPMIISEYGADSDVRIHKPTPVRYDFSIQYQNLFLQTYLKAIASCDWLSGHNWWCYNDFASYERGDSIPFVNQKGLVSNSRAHRKDAFYIMKAAFSKEPVLRILAHDWDERHGPTVQAVEVATNAEEVELFHNAKSLGTQKAPFVWKVSFVEGANHLSAKSIHQSEAKDECRFNFTPGPLYRIASPHGDGSLLSDADRETVLSTKDSIQFEMALRKEEFVKNLRLGLLGAPEREFDYNISIKDVQGKESVISGRTKKHRHGSVDVFIERPCSVIQVTLFDKESGKEISLYEVDMLTSFAQGDSIYEKVGSD